MQVYKKPARAVLAFQSFKLESYELQEQGFIKSHCDELSEVQGHQNVLLWGSH